MSDDDESGVARHLASMARRHAARSQRPGQPAGVFTRAGSFDGHFPNAHWLSAAWSPDGSQLAFGGRTTGGDGTLQVWDGESGRHEGHGARGLTHGVTGAVMSLAWAPDGEHLVTVESSHVLGQPSIKVHVRHGAKPARAIELPPGLAGSQVAWSPDGALLALSSRAPARTVFVDPASGAVHRVLNGVSGPVAWDPARRRIAGLDGTSVVLCDPVTGERRELAAQAGGSRLGALAAEAAARAGDARMAAMMADILDRGLMPTAIAWAAHGRHLAVTHGKDIVVWDTESGTPLRTLPWTTDAGDRSGDGTVAAIEWLDGGHLLEFRPRGGTGYYEEDGDASTISLWDVGSGTCLSTEVFSETVHGVAKPIAEARLAPDHRRIALAVEHTAPVICRITGFPET